MKNRLSLILLIVLLVSVGEADAQYIVRTVYFQPVGTPDATARISDIMFKTQDFYRSELEKHGYTARSFQLETDENGELIIHTLKGKHPAIHYIGDTYHQIQKELPFEFKRESPVGQNNIHVIFVAGLDRVDSSFLGVGYPYSQFHSGGNAVVAGNKASVGLVAHELGHAFGLFHTGTIGALMGRGDEFFLEYETRWLDNHHFFREKHIKTDFPEGVLDFPVEAIGGGTIRFKVAARSKSGLYHAQLCRSRGTYILGYDDTLTGKSDIIQIDASRGRLINGDSVWFQIMGVHGNYYFHHVRNIRLPEPNKKTDKPKKNPDIVQTPEPEIKVDATDDCEDCGNPDIIENAPIERDLNVLPRRLLTTQWAVLKRR